MQGNQEEKVETADGIVKHSAWVGLAFVAVLTSVVVVNLGGVFVAHHRELSPLYLLPGVLVAPSSGAGFLLLANPAMRL